MVEPRHQRQLSVQAVTQTRAYQRRLGLDAQGVQQRQQQHRLALAVAITAAPGFVGGRGHIAAFAHRQRQIAHVVLDQPYDRGDLALECRIGGLDAGDLGVQRRVRLQLFGPRIERGHHCRNLGPVTQVGQLHDTGDHVAVRQIGRHPQRRQVAFVDLDLIAVGGAPGLHLMPGLGQLNTDSAVGGPAGAQPISADVGTRNTVQRLLVRGQNPAVVMQGEGRLDDVADAQVPGLQGRGQHAVQHGGFQVPLAAQGLERLGLQHVDDLTRTNDVNLVDFQRLARGVPGTVDSAGHRQARRRLDDETQLGIGVIAGFIEADLAVHRQDAHRRTVAGGRGLDGQGDDPGGRRGALNVLGEGRAGEDQERRRDPDEQNSHAHYPPETTWT